MMTMNQDMPATTNVFNLGRSLKVLENLYIKFEGYRSEFAGIKGEFLHKLTKALEGNPDRERAEKLIREHVNRCFKLINLVEPEFDEQLAVDFFLSSDAVHATLGEKDEELRREVTANSLVDDLLGDVDENSRGFSTTTEGIQALKYLNRVERRFDNIFAVYVAAKSAKSNHGEDLKEFCAEYLKVAKELNYFPFIETDGSVDPFKLAGNFPSKIRRIGPSLIILNEAMIGIKDGLSGNTAWTRAVDKFHQNVEEVWEYFQEIPAEKCKELILAKASMSKKKEIWRKIFETDEFKDDPKFRATILMETGVVKGMNMTKYYYKGEIDVYPVYEAIYPRRVKVNEFLKRFGISNESAN